MPFDLTAYLDEARALVIDEIRRWIPADDRFRDVLYAPLLDYPLRPAKALRPALCIATCRALGGRLESALPTAAALELFHNALLVHDDVEDASSRRREGPTLHTTLGVSAAMNVGDAMLALTLRPLLDNTRLLGLGPALRILAEVADMSARTAEGQALELAAIRGGDLGSAEGYLDLVHRKTTLYSFVTPMRAGAIAARVPPGDPALDQLTAVATPLGAAFQIQDDLLNLEGAPEAVGKEHAGDLWEGKRTLMLLRALQVASPEDREHALEILRRPRPEAAPDAALAAQVRGALDGLPEAARARLAALVDPFPPVKTERDVAFLLDLLRRTDALPWARAIAAQQATEAERALHALEGALRPGPHAQLLRALVAFVVERTR